MVKLQSIIHAQHVSRHTALHIHPESKFKGSYASTRISTFFAVSDLTKGTKLQPFGLEHAIILLILIKEVLPPLLCSLMSSVALEYINFYIFHNITFSLKSNDVEDSKRAPNSIVTL
jgi:hypothetical protein